MTKPELAKKFQVRPLYLQVYDSLIERVKSAAWTPGAAIPNEIVLAQELGVSIGTVRKALEEMERKHIIVRRQGRGTFVNDPKSGDMRLRFNGIHDERGERVKGSIETLHIATCASDAEEQANLDLPPGEEVIRLRRVRSHRGRPFMWERVSLPAVLFPNLSQGTPPDTVGDLAQANGILLTQAVEKIGIAAAQPDVAAALRVPEGSALLKLDRTIATVDGRPAEWRVAFCHFEGERYVATID